MKEYVWPYQHISELVFMSKIVIAENILQKYGAECIGISYEDIWNIQDGASTYKKRIWKWRNQYVRVDRVFFPEKPFLVLEFSQQEDGPYEDADPFPYDLPTIEFEKEIRCSLGIYKS